ncbi:MAG: hypothetical protein ACOCUV_03840 [bacterium]
MITDQNKLKEAFRMEVEMNLEWRKREWENETQDIWDDELLDNIKSEILSLNDEIKFGYLADGTKFSRDNKEISAIKKGKLTAYSEITEDYFNEIKDNYLSMQSSEVFKMTNYFVYSNLKSVILFILHLERQKEELLKRKDKSDNTVENITSKKEDQDVIIEDIYFIKKYQDNIIECLKPFIDSIKHPELSSLIKERKSPNERLLFKGEANRLVEFIKRVHYNGGISKITTNIVLEWCSNNFYYLSRDKKPTTFKKGTIENILKGDYPEKQKRNDPKRINRICTEDFEYKTKKQLKK